MNPLRAASTLAVALVALAATPALMAQQSADTPRSEAETSRVAVMPFSNITGGAGDEWIGAGIAESLLTDLQGRPALAVVGLARIADAVRAVDGDARAREGDRALEVGRRVGARWLVSGAYQRLGDQLRITGRFVEVPTGTVVRSAQVDGALAQLFELQDRIVAELVDGASTSGGSIERAPPQTQPAPTLVAPAQEAPAGSDATFSFYDNVSLVGYVAKTHTPGLDAADTSYQGRFNYGGDRYGFQVDHLVVEDNFVPEVGFVRRDNFRRTYASGRFSPRPRSIEAIRQFRIEGSVDYILTADTGQVETRQTPLGFSTEFENSDRVGVSVADNYEFLVRPFTPGPGVTLPVGGYGFRDVEATYALGAQHRFNGTVTVRVGEYFDGDIRSVGFSRGRVELTQQFSVEPSLSFNWIDTPQGSFRTDLVVSRVNYTFTPRMFFSGLIQYNSATDTISNNLRLRWEYSPGSELFVVYTEDRDTDPLRPDRFSELRNRGFVVKVNRLFRF